MKLPDIIFKGRDAIEGLVPRDSSMSAVVHLGAGAIGAGVGTVGAAQLFPEHDPAKPEQYDRDEFLSNARAGMMVLAAGPLFLTAGKQLGHEATTFLKPGVSPMYFLAAGMVLGSGYITQPIENALRS